MCYICVKKKKDKNLNATFDNSLEPSFRGKYKKEDLINFLQNGNDKQKHYAVLELDDIMSFEEAQILVSNLVGQDGKIREAVSFKINQFMQNELISPYFNSELLFPVMLEGIMDINGNVCRNIVNANWSSELKQYLCENLPKRISEILFNISELEKDEKQYKISKRNFQLYWSLEALYLCLDKIELTSVKDIIYACAEFQDYTIREKIAKIVSETEFLEFDELKKKLANDENYYVRRFMLL